MAGGGIKINNNSIIGGADGATFIPFVDNNGNLSWSNNKNYPNPTPVNIKGKDGVNGKNGENGKTGAKLVSQVLQRQNENGDNVYLQTFDDGTTSTFIVPKGERGSDGSGFAYVNHPLSDVIGGETQSNGSAFNGLYAGNPYFVIGNNGYIGVITRWQSSYCFIKTILKIKGEYGEKSTISFIEINKDAWEQDTTIVPYTYKATVSFSASEDNTMIELLNDNPILFANYCFAIARVDENTITFYAYDKPIIDVYLTVRLV